MPPLAFPSLNPVVRVISMIKVTEYWHISLLPESVRLPRSYAPLASCVSPTKHFWTFMRHERWLAIENCERRRWI